jgi:hypothetical protein
MNAKRKGRQREDKTKKLLEACGYTVTKSSASRGVLERRGSNTTENGYTL